MILVETLTIIARRFLDVYCNLGFRQYAPPCIRLFHYRKFESGRDPYLKKSDEFLKMNIC